MQATVFALALLAAVLSALAGAPDTYTNDIGMRFRLIPTGAFRMGCDPDTATCGRSEIPQHPVRFGTPFYLGETEVTQAQWEQVMGDNPSHFKGQTNPVEQVSWNDAQDFIRALNEREGCRDCYRLPSEAEWEYAARAGTTTAYWFGDSEAELGRYAWYVASSGERTHPVGQMPANPWGLYDMHGNVLEWVRDCYHEDYRGAPTDGTAWTTNCKTTKDGTVLYGQRGGAWYLYPYGSRSAFRFYYTPTFRAYSYGLRVARTLPPDAAP
ncbi:Sulphatase-modifying factor protein [Thiocystis minor]|uniref:formylglycine-generating enzyme family protein n=1 Tax=Thiocystis minor TaxID=61597 RepID=UPI001913C8EF|nr:formylglycine-generating enzyme family protein [Thiocystis minor]MBK5965049.1 Sulphatase-modifying factor protein [Thiocystis minor]